MATPAESRTVSPNTLWEPVPLMELPYVVPELREDVEQLRSILFKIVQSRRELLDRLKDVQTVAEMTQIIWQIYDEVSNHAVLEQLSNRSWTPPSQRVLEESPETDG